MGGRNEERVNCDGIKKEQGLKRNEIRFFAPEWGGMVFVRLFGSCLCFLKIYYNLTTFIEFVVKKVYNIAVDVHAFGALF